MGEIQVSELSFQYAGKSALEGVSFSVPKGRFCGLLGANGAGKSTLFSLLTGLLYPRSGSLSIAGINLAKTPRKALARLGVVFQQPTLELDMTVDQNMRYFAALQGLAGKAISQRIDEVLNLLDMGQRRWEKLRSLNQGHRRRMEIARALLHRPRVLLLDEASVGLDAATRDQINRHVHDLCNKSSDTPLTVLWATHLVDEIKDGDLVVILHQGKVMARGEAGELRGENSLLERFLALTEATPTNAEATA